MNTEPSKADRFFEKATTNVESAKFLLRAGYSRAAANRAYYAMHTAATGLLLRFELDVFRKHRSLRSQFCRQFLKSRQMDTALGKQLAAVDKLRGRADRGTDVTNDNANRAVGYAENFVFQTLAFAQKK